MISYDIFMPVKDLSLLWFSSREWSKVVVGIDTIAYRSLRNLANTEDPQLGRPITRKKKVWLVHILLPSLLKFIQGIFVLMITFVIVIKSDNIIDLFKDFAAMQVISELDNAAFQLANHGYFGYALKRDTDASKEVKVRDTTRKMCFGLPLRPVILAGLLVMMMITFICMVVIGQENGNFFKHKYPNCKHNYQMNMNINDGKCDNGPENTFQCGFDGGDCLDFNMAFPRCKSVKAFEVGDGICQEDHNVEECGFDGGDCSCDDKVKHEFLGDGQCNAGLYSTVYCAYDNGDCIPFRNDYPLCPDLTLSDGIMYRDDGKPVVLGDGVCDFIPEYMTEECGFEYGDCETCKVDNPERLGDGVCDGGAYNTEACGFDNGDCTE